MTIGQQRVKIQKLGSPDFIQSVASEEKPVVERHVASMVYYLTAVELAGDEIIKAGGYNPVLWDKFKQTVESHKTPTLRTKSLSYDLLKIIINNWNDCVACAERYLVLIWNRTDKH